MTRVTVIPAAGRSSRMRGKDKLTEPIFGTCLLRRAVEIAGRVSDEVVVTLATDGFSDRRLSALQGAKAHIVRVKDADKGLSSSLCLMSDRPCHGMMILLPDMPLIDVSMLDGIWSAFDEDPLLPIRGAMAGVPGHPVILPSAFVAGLGSLRGDQGARDLLANTKLRLFDLPGRAALFDLDSPEDWVEFRQLADIGAGFEQGWGLR